MEFGRGGTGGADVTLDEEFFRCREPGLELFNAEVGEISGESFVRVIFLFE